VYWQGPITPNEARDLARDLAMYEKKLVQDLLDVMDIDTDVFFYHYLKETMHLAETLLDISPGFLTIVDDIQGVRLFKLPR